MTGPTHTRLTFVFDGELDDVPAHAAAALADLAQALLQHSDEHDGSPATMRLARLGPLLNLWLTDPECSPACLFRSGHLPSHADQDDTGPGEVRMSLDLDRDGGLRLHWALVLAEAAAAAPPGSSR